MLEWQFWIILGIIFVILEIITPTFFFLWFGISGFITAILGIFITNKIITTTFFIILSFILVIFSRKIVKPWLKSSENRKFSLDELENATGIAISDIGKNKSGIVKIFGEEWKAMSDEEIKSGDKIVVLKREGNTLVVKKLS